MPRPAPVHRCRRWADGLIGVAALALGMPTGCNSTPVRPTDFTGHTPLVRVLLLGNQTRVTLTADAPPTAKLPGDAVGRAVAALAGGTPVTLTAGGWQVGPTLIAGRSELTLSPAVDGSLHVDGKAYRGRLRFVPRPAAANTFDVVNDLDVENYLRGVLARELPPEFDPAAYAAQAVVARTYALYTVQMASAGVGRYDLFADERSQVYGGVAAESPKALAAVTKTAGEVVAYGPPDRERIFKAYFSSCCGGVGQSAADAFGEEPIPPLAATAPGPVCAASPSFAWPPVTIAKAELSRRLRKWAAGRNRPERAMADVGRVDVAGRNLFGRPVRFTVTDVAGRAWKLSGEELRTAANTDAPPKAKLLSSFVQPSDRGDAVAFVDGHGRGHGVGLCQYCAQARALSGMAYKDIVTAAYPSSVVVRAY